MFRQKYKILFMKKVILILSILLIHRLSTHAQVFNTLMFEDFSDTILPPNWQLFNFDSLATGMGSGGFDMASLYGLTDTAWVIKDLIDVGNFVIASSRFYCTDGTCSFFEYPSKSDDWIITDSIHLGQGSFLRWTDRVWANPDPNAYEVRITNSSVNDLIADSINPPLVYISRSMVSENWTKRQISLAGAGFKDTIIYIAFRNSDTTSVDPANPPIILLDSIEVFDLSARDVSMDTLYVPNYVTTDSMIEITGRITNYGGDTIHELVINWSVEEDTFYTDTISGLNIATFDSAYNFISYDFTHSIKWIPTIPDYYDIAAWVSLINGQGDQYSPNDTIEKSVRVINSIPVKKVIFEHYSGTWNGRCPDGDYKEEQILTNHPNVIGINVHINDSMEIAQGEDLILAYGNTGDNFINGSRARATVDRYLFSDQTDVTLDIDISNNTLWESKVTERLAQDVPVGVNLDYEYDIPTRSLTLDVTAFFTGSDLGPFRLNCYILEDNISDTGTGYNQANTTNVTPGHPFEGVGNPIVGYNHRNVLRHMFGGPFGTDIGIPSFVNAGQLYSHSYDTILPPDWKVDDIKLVAFIQKFNLGDTLDRDIRNATFAYLLNLVDMEVNTVNIADTVSVGSSNTFSGILTNLGIDSVHSFNLNWSISDTLVKQQLITATIAPDSTTYNYTHDSAWIPEDIGTYQLKVWADNINSQEDREHSNDTLYKTVVVTFEDTTGVENVVNNTLSLRIYPSPADDILNIESILKKSFVQNMIISNVLGEQVIHTNILGNRGLNRYSLNVRNLPEGIYLLNIGTPKESITRSFVISR